MLVIDILFLVLFAILLVIIINNIGSCFVRTTTYTRKPLVLPSSSNANFYSTNLNANYGNMGSNTNRSYLERDNYFSFINREKCL